MKNNFPTHYNFTEDLSVRLYSMKNKAGCILHSLNGIIYFYVSNKSIVDDHLLNIKKEIEIVTSNELLIACYLPVQG